MKNLVLTNAEVVLPDAVIRGTVVVRDGCIVDVQPGSVQAGIDFLGDTLIPGIVDLHTDNLERQVLPRTTARWPSRSAMLAHDSQCAAAGVTTVFDALCLGDLGIEKERLRTFRDGVVDLDALTALGLLKSEHFLHLRCEVPAADMLALLDPVAEHARVGMISLMDHTPGFGQYADVARYRSQKLHEGQNKAEVDARIAGLQENRARLRAGNRRMLLERVAARGVPLASHDDRTEEEIAENHRDGIRISEFPVTMVAAKAAHRCGMQVIGGAPNIVRGGSHSGNVAVADLVREDAIDAFASDYVPASLVEAVFLCTAKTGISLPAAVRLVSDGPAAMAGLADRGRIAPGRRADLVRVRVVEDLASVRAVWRAGERVA